MSRGSPDRDDRVQDTASALGKGFNTGREKDTAQSRQTQRRSLAGEARSLVSPDRKSELSAHDYSFGAADAGHDHPVLSGMVSDAADRSSTFFGFNIFHFVVLSGFAEGTVSAELAAHILVFAVSDGARHWPDCYKFTRRN